MRRGRLWESSGLYSLPLLCPIVLFPALRTSLHWCWNSSATSINSFITVFLLENNSKRCQETSKKRNYQNHGFRAQGAENIDKGVLDFERRQGRQEKRELVKAKHSTGRWIRTCSHSHEGLNTYHFCHPVAASITLGNRWYRLSKAVYCAELRVLVKRLNQCLLGSAF